MPQSEYLKGIASTAAASAERLVYSYPTRFSDIEAAKAYIATLCTKNAYTYGLSRTLSPEETEYIKDRVHFLVATKAFTQGEFYLDTPLPDRNALRKAIESDIQRVLRLIQHWPHHFINAHMALNYIASACALEQFVYTPFEGVAPDKFRRYVHFNTARHAFEKGVFEMRWPPAEWVEKGKNRVQKGVQRPATVEPVLKPAATLAATVTADITRLTPLLPPWPPSFPSLNAARNFVNQSAFELRFCYTGWPDLKQNRFRLFVNFNTAKEAWKKRKFALKEQPDSAAVTRRGAGKIEKKDVKKPEEDKGKKEGEDDEEEGSTASSSTLSDGKPEHGTSTLMTRNRGVFVEERALVGTATLGSTVTSTGSALDAVTPPSATETHDTPDTYNSFDPAEENLLLDYEVEQIPDVQASFDQLVTVTKDPFKDLLTEFGRTGALKKAFE